MYCIFVCFTGHIQLKTVLCEVAAAESDPSPSLSTFSSSNHISSLCVLSFYQPTPAICFSQADILLIDKITYWQMSCTPLLAQAE